MITKHSFLHDQDEKESPRDEARNRKELKSKTFVKGN